MTEEQDELFCNILSYAEHYCKGVAPYVDAETRARHAERLNAARKLCAALAAAPRWVSVTERLPDTQETLTVKLDNGQYGYGMYNGAAWVPFNDWRRTVTHWLELPPAPEAER